ncbi:MAG: hypothetical protein WCX88_01990 [Patescibacteria group bacterium]
MAKITKIKKEFKGRYLILGILTAFFSVIGAFGLSVVFAWTSPSEPPTGSMPPGPVWLQTVTNTFQDGAAIIQKIALGGYALDATGLKLTTPSAFIKDLYLGNLGKIYDKDDEFGTIGQILSSTGTGLNWIDASTSPTYTAGTGINIAGTVISNTGDLSTTNEIQNIIINKGLQRDGSYNFGLQNCATDQILKYNSSGQWVCVTDAGGTTLPSGTNGQTLRHDGTNWVANSLLYNNGTNIGIGTTSPDTQLSIYNASSGPIIDLRGSDSNYRGLKISSTADNLEKWFIGSNSSNNFVIRRNDGVDDIIMSPSGDQVQMKLNKTASGLLTAFTSPGLSIGDSSTANQLCLNGQCIDSLSNILRPSHMACVGNSCIPVSGDGINGCYSDVYCGATLTDGNMCGENHCKLVFVSSVGVTGNIGGVANADELCNSWAATASRSGTYVAWLSDSTTSAAERLYNSSTANIPYYLVDKATKIADDWIDLTDGSLYNPINLTEYGGYLQRLVFTSTNFNGLSIVGNNNNCNSWTDSGLFTTALSGDSSVANSSWTNYSSNSIRGCTDYRDTSSHTHSLYCFER